MANTGVQTIVNGPAYPSSQQGSHSGYSDSSNNIQVRQVTFEPGLQVEEEEGGGMWDRERERERGSVRREESTGTFIERARIGAPDPTVRMGAE